MADSLEILLSKEYCKFAKNIISLSQQRDNLLSDFEEYQKEFLKKKIEIEKEILSSQVKFESWKKEFLLSTGDG